MSKKKRRHYTPEQKAVLLRRQLVDKERVSEICNEQGLQPSVFYQWHRQLVANAPAALRSWRKTSQEQNLEQRIKALEAKLAKKDEVIAEVSEEYVPLKEELGELRPAPGFPTTRRRGLRPQVEFDDEPSERSRWTPGRRWSSNGTPEVVERLRDKDLDTMSCELEVETATLAHGSNECVTSPWRLTYVGEEA
ncbi:transposase [Planctomycetota bacterium]